MFGFSAGTPTQVTTDDLIGRGHQRRLVAGRRG